MSCLQNTKDDPLTWALDVPVLLASPADIVIKITQRFVQAKVKLKDQTKMSYLLAILILFALTSLQQWVDGGHLLRELALFRLRLPELDSEGLHLSRTLLDLCLQPLYAHLVLCTDKMQLTLHRSMKKIMNTTLPRLSLTWHCTAVLLALLQSGLQAAVSALRRPELLAHLLQSLL